MRSLNISSAVFALLLPGAFLFSVARLSAAESAPQTKVSYSEAYGKSGRQPDVAETEMPRFPAVEPRLAAATLKVRKGFRADLVASEPLVASPVTMSFDENGRLFVVEMIDYSERRDETPHAGRIRLLEDTNGDGIFDKSTIFADNLPWPTALICYGGGIFVGATPDILWLKDNDGDGKADERRVVFTGFASGTTRLNVQALLNSFNWGLDNRIHGATGPIGGTKVESVPAGSEPALDLRGRDFSFDPRTLRLRGEQGGGQYGLSFDSLGRKYVCSNSDHLQLILFDQSYAGLNPAFSLPNPRISIALDGPAAEVFRISPDEPWRIVRTRWRISGVVPGMVEGGGRVSGYFTGATGATIYRGDALGPDFVDNAFIGDAGGNLVHRKVISPDGPALVAQRPADEQNVEFLASRDTWFRPVHFQNAPDGCLYIADMYREVIEHPWSLPEAIKKHLDLNSGNDRGRIWRIAPEGFKQPPIPRMGSLPVSGLVASLESANGWTRETAARLIFERQDRSAAPLLAAMAKGSPKPLARLHALHSLEGLGMLDSVLVLAGMDDRDERVREHAVKLSEPFLRRSAGNERLVSKLTQLAGDPAVTVRFQTALTLGFVADKSKSSALLAIIRRDASNSWMRAAVLNSMAAPAGSIFTELASDGAFREQAGGGAFLDMLAEMIGAGRRTEDVAAVLDFAAGADARVQVASMVRSLGSGASRAGSSLAALDSRGVMKMILKRALEFSGDEEIAVTSRVPWIELLGLVNAPETSTRLVALLDSKEESIRVAAVRSLSRSSSAQAGEQLVKRWKNYGGKSRSELLAALTLRKDRSLLLLRSVQSGDISREEIPAAVARSLQASKDPAVAEMATRVFPVEPRPAELLKTFRGALDVTGNAEAGRKLYVERCATCHRAGADGFSLGPDFVTVKAAGKEKLLASILDPNAEVAPQYIAFQVETRDGENYSAIIGSETPADVTLKMATGQQLTLARSRVKGMASSGQSLMPEGLSSGMSVQDMANLLEFILTAGAPK